MVFKCQSDSYLTSFTSKVVSVTPSECKTCDENGKNVKLKGFNVILEDTVLFPEGGGQPDDRGSINKVPVLRVTRKGAEAVHFLETSFEIGQEVELKVDWERRFDHMQQHSGQHLITAIADQLFGFKTTSWDLGRVTSFIELDTPTVSQLQMQEIEDVSNAAIRNSTRVKVHVTQVGSDLLKNVRARGLPEDHVGDVRIVEIEGIDSNMCCGTHVKNLSDLSCVKLMSVEKGKKGKSNLYFLTGGRVLKYVEQMHSIEKSLTKSLKCGAKDHVEAVDRTLKQLKASQKNSMNLLRDIAILEAKQFKNELSKSENKYIRFHRREGSNEYMNIIANELKDLECFLFLTVGEEKGEGLFLLVGSPEFLEECGKAVSEAIAGKGAIKGGRMQGKAGSLKGSNKAEEIIMTFLKRG